MAQRTLPGLGLTGFWALGYDGWKDENDVNLRLLSALVQCRAISRVTALPGSPTDGDIYIVPHAAGSHPDEIAIRDLGAWVYVVPVEGFQVYVTDTNEQLQFDGSVWNVFGTGDVSLGNGAKVRAATTANVTISTALNNGDVIDGVTLVTGDAVLVKSQSTASQNGIYIVGVTPARSTAFDTYDEHPGTIVVVEEGTTLADTLWLCSSNKGGTLNTTAIAFTQMVLSGTVPTSRTITAGAGLTGGGDLSADRTLAVDVGKQTIWVPAAAMTARVTNGPSSGSNEMTTNKNMVSTLDFDTTTQEFAQFDIAMPKSWNEGTITFIPYWSHAVTSTNFGVAWGLDAVAISDDDTLDVAFGTAVVVTDTGGTTNDLYAGAESGAVTVSGSPAAGDVVQFRIHRDPANGSDNMAIDARLHGVKVLYVVDTTKDD